MFVVVMMVYKRIEHDLMKRKQNKTNWKQRMKFGGLGMYTSKIHARVRSRVWKEENSQETTRVEDTPVCSSRVSVEDTQKVSRVGDTPVSSSRVSGEETQWLTRVGHTPVCLSRVRGWMNLGKFCELRRKHGLGTRPRAWPCGTIEGKRWKLTCFKSIFIHFQAILTWY